LWADVSIQEYNIAVVKVVYARLIIVDPAFFRLEIDLSDCNIWVGDASSIKI